MFKFVQSAIAGKIDMRIYLDSAPIIYLIENIPPYVDTLKQRLSSEDTYQVCSDLTRMECPVKPLRDEQTALLVAFDSYFDGIISESVPLSRAVMDRATEIRVQYGFKTPDAIHLACATIAECDLFLTNDKQLKQFNEITVEIVH